MLPTSPDSKSPPAFSDYQKLVVALLLTFYAGFLAGTFLCGIAPNYPFLLGARVVTGLFGGVTFASNFVVHNLGVSLDYLPIIYMSGGILGLFAGPLLGRLADRIGRFRLLAIASLAGMLMVWWWTGLDRVPLWLAVVGNCALFATIAGRHVQSASGRIENYHLLGWVVIVAMALTLVQMRNVDKMVKRTARP